MVCACILFNSNNGARGSLPPSLFFFEQSDLSTQLLSLVQLDAYAPASTSGHLQCALTKMVHMQSAHAVCTEEYDGRCIVLWMIIQRLAPYN